LLDTSQPETFLTLGDADALGLRTLGNELVTRAILGSLVACRTRLAWIWIGATFQPVQCLVPTIPVFGMKNRLGTRAAVDDFLLGVSSREVTVFRDRRRSRYYFPID
jgi:hypothetical protein